jgi:hypothetical protein
VYANCIASRGRISHAIAPLTAALELRPDEWRWRAELAGYHARIGRYEPARRQLRAVADGGSTDEARAAARAGLDEVQAVRMRKYESRRAWRQAQFLPTVDQVLDGAEQLGGEVMLGG